jgi:hypothetical protein
MSRTKKHRNLRGIMDDTKHAFCRIYTTRQGRSQGVTGVTVLTRPRAQGGPGGPQKGPQEAQEGSQKGSGPGKGCLSKGRRSLSLRKRKKIRRRKIKVKGSWWVQGGRWGPREPFIAEKGALLSPRGAQVGQEDRTISNCCIEERKEKRKMRGPTLTPRGH